MLVKPKRAKARQGQGGRWQAKNRKGIYTMKREEFSPGEQKIIDMIENTCLKVNRKWYISLSQQQKHDVIMILAADMLRVMDKYEKALEDYIQSKSA